MSDTKTRCALCGYPRSEHTATKAECPFGQKHRGLGHTQFGPGVFTPREVKPRKPKAVPSREQMAEDLQEQVHNLDQPDTDADAKLANELARILYSMHGYVVPVGHDFAEATHPQERLLFNCAVVSINYVRERKDSK